MSSTITIKEQIKREPDKTLFIGGVDELVTEEEFKGYFEPFGKIVDIKLLSGRKCGFIQYEKQEDAEKALNKMNGQTIGRFPVRVSWRNSNILASPNKKTPKKEYSSYEDNLMYENKYIDPIPTNIPIIPIIPPFEQSPIQVTNSYERSFQSPYPKYKPTYGNYQDPRQDVRQDTFKRPYSEYGSPYQKRTRYENYDKNEKIQLQKRILDAERALMEQYHYINSLRQSLPWQKVVDYQFYEYIDKKPAKIQLSDLFLSGDSLIVYHFDYLSCSMCTMFLDGLQGLLPYLLDKTNFVVVSKSPIKDLEQFAIDRKWKCRVISTFESTFNLDFHAEINDKQYPAFSVFKIQNGVCYHTLTTDLPLTSKDHHMLDLFGSVWSILDLLPEGRETWKPKV